MTPLPHGAPRRGTPSPPRRRPGRAARRRRRARQSRSRTARPQGAQRESPTSRLVGRPCLRSLAEVGCRPGRIGARVSAYGVARVWSRCAADQDVTVPRAAPDAHRRPTRSATRHARAAGPLARAKNPGPVSLVAQGQAAAHLDHVSPTLVGAETAAPIICGATGTACTHLKRRRGTPRATHRRELHRTSARPGHRLRRNASFTKRERIGPDRSHQKSTAARSANGKKESSHPGASQQTTMHHAQQGQSPQPTVRRLDPP